MARKFDCTYPREGMLGVPDGMHEVECPALRADWPTSDRLRHWLGRKIPFGGVTRYEGDDSQRALTSAEHFAEATQTPEFLEHEEPKPWYVRFQVRVRNEAYSHAFGRVPSLKHLSERLLTLVIEGAVKVRRYLIWLAPYIGVGYIVFDIGWGS
ncbi:MAG: hypothetical protein OXG50_09840 [bacterium]|nr:hypothetical protein [bacterium]